MKSSGTIFLMVPLCPVKWQAVLWVRGGGGFFRALLRIVKGRETTSAYIINGKKDDP